jgi:hypothetical protein
MNDKNKLEQTLCSNGAPKRRQFHDEMFAYVIRDFTFSATKIAKLVSTSDYSVNFIGQRVWLT